MIFHRQLCAFINKMKTKKKLITEPTIDSEYQ